MILYPHMYQNVYCNLLQKNFSIQACPLYKRLLLEKYCECHFIFGVSLKATNSSFQKGMLFCLSIYMKKVMKLLAFIFEQPSYKRPKYEMDALPGGWGSDSIQGDTGSQGVERPERLGHRLK